MHAIIPLYAESELKTSFVILILFFRNVLSTSCTIIPLLKSPTRETLESIQMTNATDGILSLTAMNAVIQWRSLQSFTLTGLLVTFLTFSAIIIFLRRLLWEPRTRLSWRWTLGRQVPWADTGWRLHRMEFSVPDYDWRSTAIPVVLFIFITGKR